MAFTMGLLSILFSSCTSTITILSRSCSEELANFERASAWLFSALGTNWISKLSNWATASFISARYLCMDGSRASYSPLYWLATNWESVFNTIFLASAALHIWMPAIAASYSASLFEALNLNFMAYSKTLPSGEVIIMPAPDPVTAAEPSTYICQVPRGSSSSSYDASAMKSANACAFMAVLGLYSISYSESSTAHFSSLPEVSSLRNDFSKGWFVNTCTLWASKYGFSFLAAIIIAKAIFSISGYLCSAGLRMWLTKYTGCWALSFSTIKAAATVFLEAEMYNCKTSPTSGLAIVGRLFRWFFTSANAFFCSASHLNVLLPFSTWKNGRDLSADLLIKRVSAAIFPVNLCTSRMFFGSGKLSMASTFSGLASIPLSLTRNPRNFPDLTPNTHFFGFSFMPYCLNVANVSRRSAMWLASFLLLTMESSTYTSTFRPFCCANILSTSFW